MGESNLMLDSFFFQSKKERIFIVSSVEDVATLFYDYSSTSAFLQDVCHFILVALAVRREVGVSFSRTHPLASWLATITTGFAGSLLANFLLEKPILIPVSLVKEMQRARKVLDGVNLAAEVFPG